ncbi:unnamed protein product, partial [Larinioides sclopetarius]
KIQESQLRLEICSRIHYQCRILIEESTYCSGSHEAISREFLHIFTIHVS